MRLGGLVLVILLAVSSYSCTRSMGATAPAFGGATQPNSTAANSDEPRVDFDTQIEPILKAKCQSCHFKGGKVYDKLPFDRPETIKTLGTKPYPYQGRKRTTPDSRFSRSALKLITTS